MKSRARHPSPGALVGHAGIALAAVVVAACSGARAPAAGAAPATVVGANSAVASGIVTARKACHLLTQRDAEAAVGQPLPKNSANITLGMCDYTADDFSAGASVTVGSWESIRNAATSGKHQPEAIGGIGDQALYFAGSEKGGSPLYVRKGVEGFLLVLNGPKIDHMASIDAAVVEKDLALKIIARF